MSLDINTVDKIAFLSRLKIEDDLKECTKEEFNKMGYNSRVKLKEEKPELYAQLMKG